MVDDIDDPPAMAEINATPLIDVLLVLLIMVIVTIPVQPHLIDLALPADSPHPATPPRAITIDVGEGGVLHWEEDVLADAASLDARLDAVAKAADPPEIHLRAHADAPYGTVVAVMAAARRHEIAKFGLVDTARFLDQSRM